MFDVSTNDKQIVFVNTKTHKAEKLDLFDAIPTVDAIKDLAKEQKAAQSASKSAVSLLASILDNPRLDGYKGNTPINESIPTDCKTAVRDLETEFLKPEFEAYHKGRGANPATCEKLWQEFARGLRSGGSYAVTKGKVLAYFAHCGKLPKADNGKLLSAAAIDKLLQNEREKVGKAVDEGIAGKLVKLSADVRDRTENTKLGDPATALHALREMVATFEGLLREAQELAQAKYEASTSGDVSQEAAQVVQQAKKPQRVKGDKKPAKVKPVQQAEAATF